MKIVQVNNLTELLERISTEKSTFKVMAGGTDMMPKYYKTNQGPETVFDLSPLTADLAFIRESDGGVEIGALTTLAEIGSDELVIKKLPQLAKAALSVGSRMVRNMGTLAGNIANASPVSDTAPVLLTTGAVINTASVNGNRSISIDEFFVDYKKTAIRKDEVVKSITVKANEESGKYGFEKIAVRPEMIMAKLNFAYAIAGGEVKLATGGMAKFPVRLLKTEMAFLENKKRTDWEEIISHDVTPLTDIRSTAEYRLKVLANLIRDLGQSFPE